jgi:fumarate reductase iron-sulfur subunit
MRRMAVSSSLPGAPRIFRGAPMEAPPDHGNARSGDFAMNMLSVRVWRGGPEDIRGRFDAFEVPRLAAQTVLDVVTHIQRRIDSTLAYRFACRVGMCGSCAMTVNGKARWTCRTHVATVAREDVLEIAPLAHFPVIRDLVTDMRAFFDKWVEAKGEFVPTATRREPFAAVEPASKARRAVDAAIECIGCGVCHASCDVVGWNPAYLGPAALNRAWTLVNDPRDGGRGERLAAVAGDAGCHACHTQQTCTERCPKRLAPTASIAGLKRAVAVAAVRGEIAWPR